MESSSPASPNRINPILHTTRLYLRPCQLSDLDPLHQLWTKPEIRQFLFDDREISRQEAEAFITSSNESFANWGYGIWLCFEAEPSQFDQMPVGFAGLFAATSPTAPSLIFGMQPQRWGRGYAREATAAVIDHAFTSLGLGSVVADVDQPNLASIRVLEKLGMVEVRRAMVEERPLLYYEMLSQLV